MVLFSTLLVFRDTVVLLPEERPDVPCELRRKKWGRHAGRTQDGRDCSLMVFTNNWLTKLTPESHVTLDRFRIIQDKEEWRKSGSVLAVIQNVQRNQRYTANLYGGSSLVRAANY
ncbi:hypothetical protein EYF80_012497 [Liparis tanakae]|uniref:Uncharacterized protein n=1 Tax=Liparis tanakae TaxID=230148 RepID=A0A4Z2IIU4_9TELE|nr:hypothetical protein EYF80_012497 [Liparis tanakae]